VTARNSELVAPCHDAEFGITALEISLK